MGSVAGLLAAELQTALSLSTRAPLQQPPLTLVDLTVPPISVTNISYLLVLVLGPFIVINGEHN